MILVIGTIFIDIKGKSKNSFQLDNRNIGDIEIVYGGVGHNVARNLNYLGHQVKFISTADHSIFGQQVKDSLSKAGIDTDHLFQYEHGLGQWLAIFNEEGILQTSISKQPDFQLFENNLKQLSINQLTDIEAIVIEIDTSDKIFEWSIELSKSLDCPIYGLVSNLDITKRNSHLLKELDCFVCNQVEANSLIEQAKNSDYLSKELSVFFNIPLVYVTFGKDGSTFYHNHNLKQEMHNIKAFPAQLVDDTGAGDAYFSGVVSGLINKLEPNHAGMLASQVAAITISSKENVNQEIEKLGGNKK
jgi:pseudouridine kinase